MVATFRPKLQTTKGIDVESVAAQSAEIAALIGASGFVVDIASDSAIFSFPVPEGSGKTIETLTVRSGQVVSLTDGVIAVDERKDFFDRFEMSL